MRRAHHVVARLIGMAVAHFFTDMLSRGRRVTVVVRRVTVVVLCLITVVVSACGRHTARTARRSSAAEVMSSQKPSRGSDPANRVADAIRSRTSSANTDTRSNVNPSETSSRAAAAESGGSGSKGVVWTVETRTPAALSIPPQPPQQGRMLSRTPGAAREAGRGVWTGLLTMLLIAAVVVIGAVALRRFRTVT